ncbi:MAG: hypothetical protein JST01_23835 [Cyanobacteria bacterium SZAS TMP-1]|nr:hypothetical protein [Cyanobacteria bacterium SZAS TMP-1]
MSHGLTLVIVLLVCTGIFVGSIEQARAVMRRQQKNPGGLLEAKKNTIRGDISALALGIKQVQGYIDALKADQAKIKNPDPAQAAAAAKAAADAQASLDKAASLKKQVEDALDKADTDNAVKICELRLDQARLHVRQARSAVQTFTGADDNDDEDN